MIRIRIKKNYFIAAMILVIHSLVLPSCKNASTSSKSRLRDAPVVTVNASFRVVNSRMKINALQGKAKFKDIKMSFAESNGNQIDLKKVSNTGEILLTSATKINVTAKISNEILKDATCEARDVPMNTTAVTASFSCTSSSETPENETIIKKYPPNVTDAAERKVFDLLAVHCKKSPANLLVVDAVDRDVVYGCYCSKIDRQLLFQSYRTETINAFVTACDATPAGGITTLTASLIASCDSATGAKPTVLPSPGPGGTPAPPKVKDSCECLGLNEGIKESIKYSDFYGIQEPTEAFLKKFNSICVKM